MKQEPEVAEAGHLSEECLRIKDAKENKELEAHGESSADGVTDIGTEPLGRAHIEMLAKRVNRRSLRALGWPSPKTASMALTAGIVGAQIEGADAQETACEYGMSHRTIIYTVLLAAAVTATAYYLGRRWALMELHSHRWKRLEALMSKGPPGEKAKQDEADFTAEKAEEEPEVKDQDMPLLAVVASDDEDETTVRGSEGGRSSWSVIDETLGARPRATGRTSTRRVLVQSPVTYLRKREQPRFQPLRDRLWGALVTAESLGDG